MDIDNLMRYAADISLEERASCIQDIQLARLQGTTEEWRKACDAAIEAIRNRGNRRAVAMELLTKPKEDTTEKTGIRLLGSKSGGTP